MILDLLRNLLTPQGAFSAASVVVSLLASTVQFTQERILSPFVREVLPSFSQTDRPKIQTITVSTIQDGQQLSSLISVDQSSSLYVHGKLNACPTRGVVTVTFSPLSDFPTTRAIYSSVVDCSGASDPRYETLVQAFNLPGLTETDTTYKVTATIRSGLFWSHEMDTKITIRWQPSGVPASGIDQQLPFPPPIATAPPTQPTTSPETLPPTRVFSPSPLSSGAEFPAATEAPDEPTLLLPARNFPTPTPAIQGGGTVPTAAESLLPAGSRY